MWVIEHYNKFDKNKLKTLFAGRFVLLATVLKILVQYSCEIYVASLPELYTWYEQRDQLTIKDVLPWINVTLDETNFTLPNVVFSFIPIELNHHVEPYIFTLFSILLVIWILSVCPELSSYFAECGQCVKCGWYKRVGVDFVDDCSDLIPNAKPTPLIVEGYWWYSKTKLYEPPLL